MKTSALPQNRPHPMPLQTEAANSDSERDELIELFPLPRYFQVHFEHIHDNADALRREVRQLRQYAASLEAKLDTLLNLLDVPQNRSS